MSREIVFIDDEPILLRTLKRVLYKEPYDCSFFDNGKDALIYLERNGPPDILITDMLMPGMHGSEILKVVQKKYPSTIRGVLSGFTDNKTINMTLIGNLSHFFLHKPWNNKDFLHFISQIFSLRETLSNDGLQTRMDILSPLPETPELYNTITSMIRNDSTINMIINRISEDSAVIEKILQITNEAYCVENVDSLKKAVEIIGLDNVHLNVFASEIVEQNASLIREQRLWDHATLTNRFINHIYEKIHSCRMPVNMGAIGLLHTIGLILLLNKYEANYDRVLNRKSSDPELRLIEIENNLLNLNHMEATAFLLNQWEIPIPYVEAALHYRDLSKYDGINREIVEILHISSHMAWRTLDQEIFNYPLQMDVVKDLGLNFDDIKELFNRNCPHSVVSSINREIT